MSAEFTKYGSMKYVPSAYFFENAERHLWLKYPTLLLGSVHFEIDESGKPYYIDIDGNTYIYLITKDGKIYKAKASNHEGMLLLKEGDTVSLECSGNLISSFKKLDK